MKKFLKWTLIVLVALAVIMVIAFKMMQSNTKKFSPEDEVTFTQGDLQLEVFYNRPYKKGREIFGKLVPYGEVWRTGANEATTFSTNQDILVKGQKLKAGEYTLWTIPGPRLWQVIFNSKSYSWGVNWDGLASREAPYDVLNVAIPVQETSESIEQFTISIQDGDTITLTLAWDRTLINVPITPVE